MAASIITTCTLGMSLVLAVPLPPNWDDVVKKKAGPIRVLVADLSPTEGGGEGQRHIAERLRKVKCEAVLVHWRKIHEESIANFDVILLPTHWADGAHYAYFEGQRRAFQAFVARGGGLLICQPNPTKEGRCTPTLLPYPITFQNSYDNDTARLNLAPDHFITEDLPDADMPFPADPMIKLDARYRILARQTKSGWASLAVAAFGDGRIVVQTANENAGADCPISDEILRRMAVWAAGREKRGK